MTHLQEQILIKTALAQSTTIATPKPTADNTFSMNAAISSLVSHSQHEITSKELFKTLQCKPFQFW
jgi:hypothetical protein